MTESVYDKLSNPLAMTVFVITLMLPVAVGLLSWFRTRNQTDFYLGGRSMCPFVVALSAVASGRSSWLVLGLSGIAYIIGISAIWAIIGYILVEAWQFIYLGRKLRSETQNLESITFLDYFESKYSDTSGMLRLTGVIIIGVFMTAYVAAQFNAGAKSLSTALDLSLPASLVFSGLLVLTYMIMGGFTAVAYNDVIRAIIMLIGLIVLPITALIKIGGWGVFSEMIHVLEPAYLDPYSIGLGALVGFVGIGLGSPGQPHIVVRYMSIKNPRLLVRSGIYGTLWNILLGLGAIGIGLTGRILIPDMDNLPGKDPEMIYLALSSEYFSPAFYGLLVGGIFAAILSTADSQLLVVASTFSRDLYEKIICRHKIIHERRNMMVSRLVLLISGIVAAIMAYYAQEMVFWLVLFAWAGLGAAFGPALIMSLFWKGTTKLGILTGMISGTLITIGWRLWMKESTGIYELIPGFFLSMILIYLVSKFANSKNNQMSD
jgi:sodium/proline symporter